MTEYWGTGTADVIIGTDQPDIVDAGAGSDTVDGGGGDDVITDQGGTVDHLKGGAGDDTIAYSQIGGSSIWYSLVGTVTIDAGDGNDSVSVDAFRPHLLSIDLGAGNDLVTLNGFGFDSQTFLTLGAGSDRVKLSFSSGTELASNFVKPIVIADFQAGAGGDVLDIQDMILGYYAHPASTTIFPSANPFASGHLVLVQDGADTIVRWDYDGSGPGQGEAYYRDIFRLAGVDKSTLAAFNFGGFNPSGASNVAVDVNGTAGADVLYAGAYGSIVNGLGGNDRLVGTGGSDDLRGGDGDDRIDGGWGDDRLIGGDGNDILTDGRGSNWYDGGAGDDLVRYVTSINSVNHQQAHDDLVVFGGDGNDRVDLQITIDSRVPDAEVQTASAFVDLGAGNDRLELHNWLITPVVTLGAGQDRVELDAGYIVPSDNPYGPLVITDFQTGANGDVLDLAGVVFGLSDNWTVDANPFATGNLHAYQEGTDTAFYFQGVAIIRLENVQLSSLTAYNLDGYSVDGSATVGIVRAGTASADLIDGTAGNDQLTGADGNDEIHGGFGNDAIDGGIGNDQLYGGYGTDTLNGGDGDDVIEDVGDGSSTVNGGEGNDRIRVESVYGPGSKDVTINAGNGNDDVRLNSGHDGGVVKIDLGAGNDRLTLETMNQFDGPLHLTMGAGQDTLVIDEAAAINTLGPIEITDFQTGDNGDRIDWLAYAQEKLSVEGDPDSFDPFVPSMMYGNSNPLFSSYAKLVQSGADTLLQIAPGGFETTLIIFRNTSVGSFTDFNLGLATQPTALTGGAGNDALIGTANNDTMSGLAGDDMLRGRDGNDTLTGGDGTDMLIGGEGNDNLNGNAGRDHLDGGNGDDKLTDNEGTDVLIGGFGDDTVDVTVAATGLTVPVGALDAGRGDDVISITGGGGYHVVAGDGIDTVTIRAGTGATNVELGASADFIDVHRLTGDLTLSLGTNDSGDRIRLMSDFGTAGQGVIRVSDFDHSFGNYDLIEFSSYLTAITGGAWNSATNPFAAGYVQLKQGLGGTEVWFNPTGHAGSGSVLGLFLQYVTASDLTAANFGGYDPLVSLPVPRSVAGTVQNPQGTTISMLNNSYVERVRAGFVFQQNGNGSTPDSLVNAGTVKILDDGSDGGAGTMAGIYVTFPGSNVGSSFHNTATGSFIVESQAAGDVGPFDSFVYGYYLPSSGDVSFVNDGLFEVRAARSYAIGIESYASINVANNGTLRVVSADSAIGISHVGSSRITNTGLIDVHGGSYALGVELMSLDPAGFVNAGTIRAAVDPGTPYASIGLAIWQDSNVGTPVLLKNSGTIDADIAIYVNYKFGFGTNYDAIERVENSGTIKGDVYLSYGDDQVINTGLMTGVTLLESGNDFYDGRTGQHDGVVDGGGGDDRLWGGAHDDVFDGGRGNDMIIAGGGDDIVYEGSGGSDAVDGGAGYDLLSFIDAWQGVNVDLANEVAVNLGTSHVRGFEAVVGSGFADTLKGSNAADLLEGAAGDDAIDGGAGDDLLYGDSGADTLTGGAGNDRFLFSRGDGADKITDFSAGDTIEVYGYDAYLSLEQVGSAVRVNLSATDSILIANATVASITATNLTFNHDELAPEPAPVPTTFLRLDDPALVIPAGTTLNLGVTDFQDHYLLGLQQAAIFSETIHSTGTIWNGGAIKISANASEAPLTGIIWEDTVYGAGGYPTLNAAFYNLAGGLFQVTGHNGDVRATEGTVSNAGTISAFSDGGDAFGVYTSSQMVLNWGTVAAQASGHATGIEQAQGGFYNLGSITANSGDSSVGIFTNFSTHPLAPPPSAVNAGQVIVTDGTGWMDSVALKFDIIGVANFWNSGTAKADFALNGGARGDASSSFNIYNSGTLDGIVRTADGVERLYNSGTITGSVELLAGDDLYDGRLGHVGGQVSGGDGNDRLYGGVQADVLSGGLGDDFLFGGAGSDKLAGGLGRDTFHVEKNGGQDEITDFQAGAGGDVIDVSGYSGYSSLQQQGADVLVTFSATDSILIRNVQASAIVAANFAFDAAVVPGQSLPPVPTAPVMPTAPTAPGAPAFQYYGTAADDVLVGGIGPDEFDGGAGADRMYGKSGDDLYHVDRQDDLVFEDAGGGTDTVIATGNYYLYANIEILTQASGAGDIFGVGNELANTIVGNEGANLLLGGAGDDAIYGNAGGDQLYGQDGVDTIYGDAGVDYLIGGAGNDVLYGGNDEDGLYGEDGNDILWGGDDFKTDILVGGAGNDVLHGDSGLGEYDAMDGGAGDDIYYADSYADVTYEAAGGGTDTVYADVGGASGYYLYGNVENLVLTGTSFYGVGNELANHLTGNASANWLLGGAGNDVLDGKAGNDVLFGQDGTDTFVFGHGTGGDTIADFTAGVDRIDLSAFGFASFAQLQAAMSENGGSTAIQLGDGDFIVLQNVANASLHQGDFVLSGGSSGSMQAEQLARDTADPLSDTASRAGLIHQFDNPHTVVFAYGL